MTRNDCSGRFPVAAFRVLAAVAGLLLLSACARGPVLRSWFVDSLVKVFPDSRPGKGANDQNRCWVARNGHASLQLAVRSGEGIAALDVKITPPHRNNASLQVETRWVDYVPVGSNPSGTPYGEVVRPAPALFPDPLREDFPLRLEPDFTRTIWITVSAPPDTAPGDYEGRITLLDGDTVVAAKSFHARVMEATVPLQQHLQVTTWFHFDEEHLQRFYDVEEYSDRYWDLLGNIGRVMARHRQNVLRTPVTALARPSLAGGHVEYDFARLDKWVETFERAGVLGTIEGRHLLRRGAGTGSGLVVPAMVIENGKVVRKALPPDDPRVEPYLRSFLSALYTHLKEKGWKKRYIQHILDEPHGREAPVYHHFGKIVRESLPGIPTIDAVSLRQNISFFADTCDIWVPLLGSFDHKLEALHEHARHGGAIWFYTCLSPRARYLNRFIDFSLLKVRLLPWFNFRHGFTGYLHWGGNVWGPKPFDNVQPVISNNRTLLPAGDNAIVYPDPANNSVLGSIRLEAMRDGIEDYELLLLLSRRDAAAAAELAREAIPHINDYVRNPAVFRRLHRRLLEEVKGK